METRYGFYQVTSDTLDDKRGRTTFGNLGSSTLPYYNMYSLFQVDNKQLAFVVKKGGSGRVSFTGGRPRQKKFNVPPDFCVPPQRATLFFTILQRQPPIVI